MALTHLSVRDFRCFETFNIDLDPGNNLLVGANASGKTSFLESIFFLGRGRSFRVTQSQRLIRQGVESFTLSGQVLNHQGRTVPLGVRFRPNDTLIKVAGQRCGGFATLADNLPVQVIHPEVHHLVDSGPGYRRRFLDWGVFHVKPTFLGHWREFSRALKQRNAGLRQNLPANQLNTWTDLMMTAGEAVTRARRDYVAQLDPFVARTAAQLLGQTLEIHYRPGWREDLTYAEAIQASEIKDRERKTTQIGPQRAELALTMDGHAVQGLVSRGQQKLLAATLILAQIQLLESLRPRDTVLLLDDPAAELDDQSLIRFLELVGQLDTQLFVTALRSNDLPDGWSSGQVFHVKQGVIG